jgi:hypothetical protein
MSETVESLTYLCRQCGYQNVWTREEILQRGEAVLYRSDTEEVFSLPCKNPTFRCPQRTLVAVPIESTTQP